jgi:hypothetical protein
MPVFCSSQPHRPIRDGSLNDRVPKGCPMRRFFLVGFGSVLALILAYQPAFATNVTDYPEFTNSTTINWTRSSFTLGSGETMGYAGPSSVNAGGISDAYYTALANTISSSQIVWASSDNLTSCTFNSSTAYNTYYQLWQVTVSASSSGGPHKCNITKPSDSSSSGYTLVYSVSN